MRKALLVVVLLISVASLPALGWGATYVISDFETDPDLGRWEGTDGASLSRVALHPTHGSYSCLMDLPVTTYPGMSLVSFPTTDWSAYDVMRMDLYNPLGYALVLHIEISDSVQGSSWPKRYYTEKAVIPGPNQIEVDLHTMTRVDGSGNVDAGHINRFLFYLTGFSSPTATYLDYVRLETAQDDPAADAARGIWKFDFGTASSPRWRDFFRVTTEEAYSGGRGWGWVNSPYRYSGDNLGPDDLARDYVRPLCCPTGDPLEFRLDLPNGGYTVYVIARASDLHGMPVTGWEIWAEGVRKVNVPMDSTQFYSTDYYYRGMDLDYPPAQSYWDTYEAPNYPAYQFTTTVSDGQLDLSFYRAWVHMLVVYPTGLEPEMGPRIAGWEADRQTQFESSYYVNEPEDLTFTPTAAETTRGYAAWPVAVMDPCHPDTLPPAPRPAISLSATACWDEYRAVALAIRPLVDLTGVWVEVSDLSDGSGHLIPSAEVEKQYVRYLATPDTEFFGSGVLSWKPRLLQGDFPIEVAHQVSKEFWLTVHVPDGAPAGVYTGTVTIHASSGDLVAPLSVEVWPLSLDGAEDMAYGWYYMSPDERYCLSTLWWPDMAGRADEILRLDLADMRKHGFNSLQFPTPWASIDAGGHVTGLDMSELERYVSAMNEVGFGGDWRGQVGTLGIGNQLMNYVPEFGTQFNASFKDALAMIVAWGNGASGTPLACYLVDEPRESGIQSWNRNFADSMQYCDLANQVAGCVSTITVMSDSGDGVDYTPFAGALDIMQTHPWPPSAGLISASLEQGKPIWFYNTGGDLRMVYGFYQYKYGRGCWEWHYDWLDGDTFDTCPYSPFNNHWHYTYPSPEGPVATLNHEWASQGITDYRYAATLERLAQEARASGLPESVAWADAADALLAALREDVPQYAVDASYRPQHFAGIADGPGCLTAVGEALDGYRRQIVEAIATRPEETAGPTPEVVLEDHPNERAPGAASSTLLGKTPWTNPVSLPAPGYWWKTYRFAASGVLWIQVCGQNFSAAQNGYNDGDDMRLMIDGVVLNDYDGIQRGALGSYQWSGNVEKGERWTLRFLALNQGGLHNLRLSADQAPILWWVKVTDLEPQLIYP